MYLGQYIAGMIREVNNNITTVDEVASKITDFFFPKEGDTPDKNDILFLSCQILRASLRPDIHRNIDEFRRHCKRFLSMYLAKAGVEVDRTTRYEAQTGKVEAKVCATRKWLVGDEIRCLQGINTDLSKEEEEALGGSRDFSVMFSSKRNCACLFTGPGRFVNHDCVPNVKVCPFFYYI